jgi:hypothetical protein
MQLEGVGRCIVEDIVTFLGSEVPPSAISEMRVAPLHYLTGSSIIVVDINPTTISTTAGRLDHSYHSVAAIEDADTEIQISDDNLAPQTPCVSL